MSREDLAEQLRRSVEEPEAFATFYRECFDSIFLYLARRTVDVEVALDLAAECFAQAYLSRARFRGRAAQQAEAWIFRIAKRQLARYLRRGKLERAAIQRLAIEVPTLERHEVSELEAAAELAELRSLLRHELGRVSAAQRDAVQLRVVDELPYAVVADQLEITEQAARLRVSRGLRALAEALDSNQRLKELRA